ncbi:MAG: hypothetical protein J7L23_02375, partial [Candidatus Diapherotrites archaeon]|nr:hypothetical protein [Candidatus Diapherotrites archaeon]
MNKPVKLIVVLFVLLAIAEYAFAGHPNGNSGNFSTDKECPVYSDDRDNSTGGMTLDNSVYITVFWDSSSLLGCGYLKYSNLSIDITYENGTTQYTKSILHTCVFSETQLSYSTSGWCDYTLNLSVIKKYADENGISLSSGNISICWKETAEDTIGHSNRRMTPHCFVIELAGGGTSGVEQPPTNDETNFTTGTPSDTNTANNTV